MAKKQHNEVAVGLTVLIVLVLTIYIVVALADWSDLFTQSQEITVQLPYQVGLKGLAVGSPIFLGGMKIGQITGTRIEKLEATAAEAEKVYVFFTMEIPTHYQLRSDCILAPQSNVLGGQASLDLKDLGSEGEILKDGQTVSLQMESSIAEAIDNVKCQLATDDPDSLLNKLKEIIGKIDEQVTIDQEKQSLMAKVHIALDHIDSIAERIDNQLDEHEKETAVAKLHSSLDTLNHSLTQIDEIIKTNKTPIIETVASVRKTAKNVEENVPQILEQINASLAKADSAMEAGRTALADLKTLIGSVHEMVLVNRESIDSLVRNMQEVSVNFKMASRQIRRAPWMLIYKPKKGELHIQGLIDAAGDFAVGAERLDAATERLHAMLATSEDKIPLNQELINSLTAELETSFERFKTVEEKFWQEMK